MAKIDLHKLAITIGFEIVCVDDEYTNYEYMMRIRDIESISYIIKIKNTPSFFDVDEIVNSLIVMLPRPLKRKIKKLMRKKDSENIDNVIDLLCYTVSEYNSKTKYSLLKEYGEVVGINIEEYGYYFTYKISKNTYAKIISLIESKLPIEAAPKVGKIKDLEHKIAFVKQNKNIEEQLKNTD